MPRCTGLVVAVGAAAVVVVVVVVVIGVVVIGVVVVVVIGVVAVVAAVVGAVVVVVVVIGVIAVVAVVAAALVARMFESRRLCLHVGHVLFMRSHSIKLSGLNMCPQCRMRTTRCVGSNVSCVIEHTVFNGRSMV